MIASLLFPAALFCIWCTPLFVGRAISRVRASIPAVTLIGLSALWFSSGWKYGVQYQGLRYTAFTALGSLSFAITTLSLLALSRRRADSVAYSLAIHFVMFVWTLSYFVPWLGEFT